jgi:hypothetical protein
MEDVSEHDMKTVEPYGIGGEFRGDFTRNTFDPSKSRVRVLMQQGRPLLDSDYNEQSAIQDYILQTLVTDLIGPHAGPMKYCGFEIISTAERLDELVPPPENIDELKSAIRAGNIVIGEGRYYVEGRLCVNEQYVPYTDQPHLPDPDELESRSNLVYLDVWERHITSNEDDSIREVALGGPGTATRSVLVWQVRSVELQEAVTQDCDELLRDKLAELRLRRPGHGKLSAATRSDQSPEDDCTVSPDSGYRGPQNQLYRVEIHGSTAEGSDATFLWSRNNASFDYPIVMLSAGTATVKHLGKDDDTTLKRGNWVEVVDDRRTQHGLPGPLFEVEEVDPFELTVKLKVPETVDPPPAYGENSGIHPLLRRWDSQGLVPVDVADSNGNGWIALEDGIEVKFHGDNFMVGDYWQIPARTATGDIEWPQKATGNPPMLEPVALPPHGIIHHYAPLAIVEVRNGGVVVTADCRYKFRSLGEPSSPPQQVPPANTYTYRRKRRSNIWHFCINCPYWPDADFVDDFDTESREGRLCQVCQDMQRNNEC